MSFIPSHSTLGSLQERGPAQQVSSDVKKSEKPSIIPGASRAKALLSCTPVMTRKALSIGAAGASLVTYYLYQAGNLSLGNCLEDSQITLALAEKASTMTRTIGDFFGGVQ